MRERVMSGQDFDRKGMNSNPGLAKSTNLAGSRLIDNPLRPFMNAQKQSFVSSKNDSEEGKDSNT